MIIIIIEGLRRTDSLTWKMLNKSTREGRSDEAEHKSFDKELVDFIFAEMPLGVIVFDAAMNIIYQNRRAGNFLQRYQLPAEVTNVCGRIFDAMKTGKLEALFPERLLCTRA